jgi:hypothetical protein
MLQKVDRKEETLSLIRRRIRECLAKGTAPSQCEHKAGSYCEVPIADGRVQIRWQCNICGAVLGPAKAKSGVDVTTIYNPDLQGQYRHAVYRGELLNKLYDREKYLFYLNSSQWKLRRQLVLVRDGFECQAKLPKLCEITAVDAHHNTYEHFGWEPLFDLVAVCRACHDALHPDREKWWLEPVP